MEIHRQQCQTCRSYDLNNILVRQAGAPTAVFVRCKQCGELVARYELSSYYHHGKAIESFLRSKGPDAADSGRQLLAEFERAEREATSGYEEVLATLNEEGKSI